MASLDQLITANNDPHPWVVGLKGASGVVPRRDVDVLLLKFPKTFNLFLLALDELQKEKYDKPMSYFQIAGIHGYPKIFWDNVGGKDKSLRQSGYCSHSKLDFPTWHRPYLAMLEQAIYVKMLSVAEKFNEPYKSEYKEAVKEFRLPYWDYYRPRGGPATFPGIIRDGQTAFDYDYSVPTIFTESTVMVRMHPDNTLQDLKRNPLFHFDFNAESTISKTEWDNLEHNEKRLPRNHTLRHPDGTSPDGDIKKLNDTINSFRMDCNRLTINLISDNVYRNYEIFSNDKSPPQPKFEPKDTSDKVAMEAWEVASGSLEGLHDLYHGLLGRGGHIGRVATAAFDPLFWMHHCQIDRLFALWQAVHHDEPKSWFQQTSAADAPLLPFRKTNSDDPKTFWNSTQSKDCEPFGYTYEDLVGKGKAVTDRFNYLYEWSVPLTKPLQGAKVPQDMKPLDLSKSEFFKSKDIAPPANIHAMMAMKSVEVPAPIQERVAHIAEVRSEETEAEEASDEAREWFIDDHVERLALNGAFAIFYFISDKDDSPALGSPDDYYLEPTVAGAHYVFAAPVEACDNCGRQQEQAHIVSNTAAITSMLLDYVEVGHLQSLDAAHVVPFLKKRLRWRVVTVNGDKVDPRWLANEKSLEINVSCKVARFPRNSAEPRYEEYPAIIQEIIGQASATPSA